MAEKQCNLIKNGGGMSDVLDFPNAINIYGDGVTIDATGLTYTATQRGLLMAEIRMGNADVRQYINGNEYGGIYLPISSATTAGSAPALPFPYIEMNIGDVYTIKRVYGNYSWTYRMKFVPYKT